MRFALRLLALAALVAGGAAKNHTAKGPMAKGMAKAKRFTYRANTGPYAPAGVAGECHGRSRQGKMVESGSHGSIDNPRSIARAHTPHTTSRL